MLKNKQTEELDLDYLVEKKDKTIEKLNKSIFDLAKYETEYSEQANKYWVETDFSEVITESRPTVDMKKAYIDMQLKDALRKIHNEERNIEILKNELKSIDTQIKVQLKYLDVICEFKGL